MKNQQFVSSVLSELLVLAMEYRKEARIYVAKPDGQPDGARAEGFAEGLEAACAWFTKAKQAQGENKARIMSVLKKAIEDKRAGVAKMKHGDENGGDDL